MYIMPSMLHRLICFFYAFACFVRSPFHSVRFVLIFSRIKVHICLDLYFDSARDESVAGREWGTCVMRGGANISLSLSYCSLLLFYSGRSMSGYFKGLRTKTGMHGACVCVHVHGTYVHVYL